jgi:hypothetical protein
MKSYNAGLTPRPQIKILKKDAPVMKVMPGMSKIDIERV